MVLQRMEILACDEVVRVNPLVLSLKHRTDVVLVVMVLQRMEILACDEVVRVNPLAL